MKSPDLIDAFLGHATARSDHTALLSEDPARPGRLRATSWGQLAEVVRNAAEKLQRRLGDQPGYPPHIGHASDNSAADVVIAIASMVLGTTEVPIDHRYDRERIEALWRRLDGLWVNRAFKGELERAIGEVDASRPDPAGTASSLRRLRRRATRPVGCEAAALILWTSGTTREPKGAMLSQRSLASNAAAKLEAVPQRRDDVRLTVLPLAHAYARTCDFGTWLLSGSRLAVTLGFDGWNRLARSVRPTLVNTVPRMAERLKSAGATERGLERLRLLGCGGAALSSRAFECWRSRGVTVIQGYGLTEAGPVICSATPDNATAGLVGRPVAGWETEIREGRLFVRGPHTMLGYWNDPHATRAKMHRDGWLDTGDLVEIDSATGQFRILGRADDVIVLDSGRKVHPGEIERALATVPGVARALVTSVEGGVEAWLDLDTGVDIEDEMVRAMQNACVSFPAWQRPARYQAFDPPLSLAREELTIKGTLRRQRVLDQRLGNGQR